MGLCTYVIGFKPKDDKYDAMKLIWESCKNMNISVPIEVDTYFEGYAPDDVGVRVDLDIKKLPKDVTIIRFINSW